MSKFLTDKEIDELLETSDKVMNEIKEENIKTTFDNTKNLFDTIFILNNSKDPKEIFKNLINLKILLEELDEFYKHKTCSTFEINDANNFHYIVEKLKGKGIIGY